MQLRRLHLIADRIRKFRDDNSAVAAVEFALILPLLLTLYLGSVEASTLYTADRKIDTIASSMADLVSRQKGTVRASDLQDYFTAAANVMQPLSEDGLGQIVSFLKINSSGVATVLWSEANGTATKRATNSPYPLDATTEINRVARNADGFLVVAEVSYPYEPIVGHIINSTVNISHVHYFLPRFEEAITLAPNS